jgi:hypothetical protein
MSTCTICKEQATTYRFCHTCYGKFWRWCVKNGIAKDDIKQIALNPNQYPEIHQDFIEYYLGMGEKRAVWIKTLEQPVSAIKTATREPNVKELQIAADNYLMLRWFASVKQGKLPEKYIERYGSATEE